ncbi:hypothetical protein BCV70DRAFT_200494 [Testicularia cyperi]|uniref:Uncharacterized protein n=1 Tax=Testicularia cyperi TaxID=1882483 RepID=A0A317XR11_9BASI|nr:hypothetical protein BCV70DRAFT_200494 [Testicularia cyperi]
MAATPASGRASAVAANGASQPHYSSPSRNTSSAASIRAPSVLAMQARRSYLDESALSPQEFIVYLTSFASVKPSPSGQPGLIDEQDGLRYLREECGMSMADELEILPLFERTPLGLGSGHFFAMLRLVSWAQQGQSATKELLFTQTKPARISHRKITTPQSASAATFGNVQQITTPGPRSSTAAPVALSEQIAPSTSAPLSKPAPPKPDHSTKPQLTPVREEPQSPNDGLPDQIASLREQSLSSSRPPAVPAKPQMPQLVAPKPKVANPNIPLNLEELQRKPAPVPPSTSANPFRDGVSGNNTYTSGSGYAVAVGAAPVTPANISAPTGALLGFDPAPNPFKQNKPRIVKPTPVRASSPASNPFRNGTPAMAAQSHFPKVVFDPPEDGESSQASSSRSRQQMQQDRLGAMSPPLPPRPGDRNPPPLPPRHISPLIQAGLNARSEVRRAQESLPPKTFTVLQSSTSRHGSLPPTKPRLLTGQAAPPEVPPPLPPSHHAKKRSVSGAKSFLSGAGASSAVGAESRRSYSDGHHLQRRDSQQSHSDVGRGDTDLGTSVRRTSSQLHRGESEVNVGNERVVPTVAPKAVYAKKAGSSGLDESVPKVKPNLPSWLKEQEELQREALASGYAPPPPPPIQPTEGGVRGRASRTVIDELNESAEAMSDEAAAANAASIERNNPFFPPHARDAGRSPNPAVADVEGADDSQVSSNRPLGRSKTTSSAHRPPPPRRRVADGATVGGDDGSAQWGHSLDAGTYAGFKPNKEPKNSGGLRLVPPSKQVKMLEVSGADQLEQEGIRPAQDLRKVSGATSAAGQAGAGAGDTSENSSGNGPLSPTTPSGTYPAHPGGLMRRQGSLGTTIRERVSDILRLQDQPPKGQRHVDMLGQDIANFVNKNEWLARKRDSLVRSNSGAARERERLIGMTRDQDDDDDDQNDVYQDAADDEPHPDTDPSHNRRHSSHVHQRSLSGGGAAGGRDPFSSPPPLHEEPQQHGHIPPPPQHPSGVRRSGSLNTKRSSSYQYPTNNSNSIASAGAGGGRNYHSGLGTASSGAAAGAPGTRRWSSFHQPQNSLNYLNSQSHHPAGHGATSSDALPSSAWRDLRGSAVDEEDADEDIAPAPATSTLDRDRDHSGYAQL